MTVTLAPSVSPATVAVASTTTPVVTVECRASEVLTIQLVNTDGTQTFNGTVQRRTYGETTWSDSSLPDFQGIGPGSSVMADIDVRGSAYVRLVGTMSGVGGNVRVSTVRRSAR